MRCACLSAIGRRRTRRTTSTPRSQQECAAAIRRTTSSSRIPREAVLVQDKQEVMRCASRRRQSAGKVARVSSSTTNAPEITEFRKAVEQFKADLPAVLEALRAMIERAHKRNRQFRKAARRISQARAGDDQSEPHRSRRARDADPAHPHRRGFHRGLSRHAVSPGQQRRAGAVQAGGDFLHRRHQVPDARRAWSRTTPRSAPPPRRSPRTTRSRPSSKSSTRTSTRSTTPRPRTGSASSTRRTRSSAS